MLDRVRVQAGTIAGSSSAGIGEDVLNPGRSAILDGRGEMAERLKAAVC